MQISCKVENLGMRSVGGRGEGFFMEKIQKKKRGGRRWKGVIFASLKAIAVVFGTLSGKREKRDRPGRGAISLNIIGKQMDRTQGLINMIIVQAFALLKGPKG